MFHAKHILCVFRQQSVVGCLLGTRLTWGIYMCVWTGSAMRGFRFGLPVAVAIGLHNIPEGIAVAVPYYSGTRSRTRAFLMAALSGLVRSCDPVGWWWRC